MHHVGAGIAGAENRYNLPSLLGIRIFGFL